ncbi:uncharacterized protein SOCE26_013430 [Sorangium cellulosum]|uniref:Uncharacterized protein n=1 Tax=Sorangium cellulosum TaxID=56 RepID=A0A2L0EKY8_SORCE|nr:uncharacterized protein SOCE26_013430 [Sorangium cellulosum]
MWGRETTIRRKSDGPNTTYASWNGWAWQEELIAALDRRCFPSTPANALDKFSGVLEALETSTMPSKPAGKQSPLLQTGAPACCKTRR